MTAPRLGRALLLILTLTAAADEPYSVSMRSRQHEMTIDVRPLENGASEYDVRVVELRTGAVVAEPRLVAKEGESKDTTTTSGGRHYMVHVKAADGNVNVYLRVEENGSMIDMLSTFWNNVPHRARLRVPGAVRAEDEGVNPPAVIHHVDPVYTEAALKNRVSGIVVLDLLVDKTGEVKDVAILDQLPFGLSEAAVAAVKQWRFRAATGRDGQAVDVLVTYAIPFHLPPSSSEVPQ